MEIPARISAQDIHDLLCPATLSNELLHHLITSACPPEHPKVTIAGQLLTDVLDNMDWDRTYYDENEIGNAELHLFLQQIWTK